MDVIELLERYSIEYVDGGPNVAKGNVNVQCPWCGDEDRSHHCGINLEHGMYGCWRNTKHRGRRFANLLSKLTGISITEARRQTGEGSSIAIQPSELENLAEGRRIGLTEAEEQRESRILTDISFPAEFREMFPRRARSYKAATMFRRYLYKERKFPYPCHKKLARQYGLHYCVKGRFADRLIIPVYENGKLMTYLGRSIQKGTDLRYLALEKEDSVKQVKDCVYNYDDALKGGRTLVIVEGAIDAMKIDFYGKRNDCRAVGLFNMNVEDSQIDLLYNLRGRFNFYKIMLDSGQVADSLGLESMLGFFAGSQLRLEVIFMEEHLGFTDPGDLTARQARELTGSF